MKLSQAELSFCSCLYGGGCAGKEHQFKNMGAGGGCHDGACTIRYDQLSIAPSYSVPSCVALSQPAAQLQSQAVPLLRCHVCACVCIYYCCCCACLSTVVGTHRKLGSEQAGGIVHPLPLPALQKPHPAPAVAAGGGGGGGSAGAQHGYVVYGAEWCVI